MAHNAKQKIDGRLGVQQLFTELLERAGVSDALLAQRIRDGLYATAVSKATRYAGREVLVDYGERREMVEVAILMKGLKPAEEHKHTLTLEDLLSESHE